MLFELSVSLMRVLELTIAIAPDIFLDWQNRDTSETLAIGLIQVFILLSKNTICIGTVYKAGKGISAKGWKEEIGKNGTIPTLALTQTILILRLSRFPIFRSNLCIIKVLRLSKINLKNIA